jgi:thioesterase domain-containing protein/aryl carrier-like protein
VGIEDDFFALGGHSLAAVRLMAGLRRLCGRDIPVSELFRRPTIAALAELLRALEAGEPTASSSPLLLLASGPAEATPLFCVHGASGNALVFADLARALGSDRPVYGLEARGLVDGESILESVDTMAELYLAAVREVRPHGPYRLLGYSMGSKIAFEMARRLDSMGETVELLALMDIVAVVPEGFTGEEAEVPAEIRQLPDFDAEIARRHLDVLHANRRASLRWAPKTYPGNALLFVTAPEDSGGKDTADPTLGWGGVTLGEVEVVPVSGDHFSMLRTPHVEALVKRLQTEPLKESS